LTGGSPLEGLAGNSRCTHNTYMVSTEKLIAPGLEMVWYKKRCNVNICKNAHNGRHLLGARL